MAKVKVLLNSIWYPMAIARYWERAFRSREDVELMTVGSFTGNWIPWKGGMTVPQRYAISPDIPLPQHYGEPTVNYNYVRAQLGDWKPDLVVTVDAGRSWDAKPSDGFVAHIATDAHCLDYTRQRRESDKFFNMHERYAESGDHILPYAYDHTVHYREDGVQKEYDVVMVGVEYEHRIKLAQKLRAEGINLYFSNGEIFDEYRQIHQKAHIGLNWSSLDDLNARAFELPAMGNIPVMNTVKDMELPRHKYFDFSYLFPVDNYHTDKSIFVDGAVERVKMVMSNLDDAKARLETMRKLIENETYANRVSELLSVCGF